jgi:PKD repeat protein
MIKRYVSLISIILALSVLVIVNPVLGENSGKDFTLNTNDKTSQVAQGNHVKPLLQLDYGNLPLYFIPNKGQVKEEALFYSHTKAYTLWLTKKGLVFDAVGHPVIKSDSQPSKIAGEKNEISEPVLQRDVVWMNFINGNSEAKISPVNTSENTFNYFRGKDSSKWISGLKTSLGVKYADIYDGIDVTIYGKENLIEYDWIVKAGSDPNKIKFEYKNAKSTEIAVTGDITMTTEFGVITHKKPYAYQIVNGEKIEVDAAYETLGANRYGFKLGKYDKECELVIDPVVIVFSGKFGGNTGDLYVPGFRVDGSGNMYFGGMTYATDLPVTAGAYDTSHNGGLYDLYLAKLNATGTALIYCTYIGGSGSEHTFSNWPFIDIDGSGCAYIAGATTSTDYPVTPGAFQTTFGGVSDSVISKLSADGTALVFSTYLGGNSSEWVPDILVDSTGAVYIAGATISADFPTTPGAYDTTLNSIDCYITKLNSAGTGLIFSTFLGGTNNDYLIKGIAIDSSGNICVSGQTNGNFPVTAGAYDTTFNGGFYDTFIAKLNSSGSSLLWATYLGGNGGDYPERLFLDGSDQVYITGDTDSGNFPTTPGAYDTTLAGTDIFVTKLDSSASTLIYSTLLGGSNYDNSGGITVDSRGYAFIAGMTLSNDFPVTADAYDTTSNGGFDAILTILNDTGTDIEYSTYFGGSSNDYGRDIALSGNNLYVGGGTDSSDIPITPGAINLSIVWRDAYAVLFNYTLPAPSNTNPVAVISADRFGGIFPLTINFDGGQSYDNDGTIVQWQWNLGDGNTAADMQVAHIYNTPGTYTVTLKVRDNSGAWSTPATAQVMVLDTNDLSFTLSLDPLNIKANGMGTAVITAIAYQISTVAEPFGRGAFITVDLGINFTATSGAFEGAVSFDSATGQYTQKLISGAPGTATIGVTIGGCSSLATATIEYTWPQPPLNLKVVMKEDRGLFKGVYYSYLSWSANTSDIYAPAFYKIYRSTDGGAFENIGTTNASTFEYVDSNVAAGQNYTYAVSTVDGDGDESALSTPVNAN